MFPIAHLFLTHTHSLSLFFVSQLLLFFLLNLSLFFSLSFSDNCSALHYCKSSLPVSIQLPIKKTHSISTLVSLVLLLASYGRTLRHVCISHLSVRPPTQSFFLAWVNVARVESFCWFFSSVSACHKNINTVTSGIHFWSFQFFRKPRSLSGKAKGSHYTHWDPSLLVLVSLSLCFLPNYFLLIVCWRPETFVWSIAQGNSPWKKTLGKQTCRELWRVPGTWCRHVCLHAAPPAGLRHLANNNICGSQLSYAVVGGI